MVAWRVTGFSLLRKTVGKVKEKKNCLEVEHLKIYNILIPLCSITRSVQVCLILRWSNNTSTSWQRSRSKRYHFKKEKRYHFPQRLKPINIQFTDTSNGFNNVIFNTTDYNEKGRDCFKKESRHQVFVPECSTFPCQYFLSNGLPWFSCPKYKVSSITVF